MASEVRAEEPAPEPIEVTVRARGKADEMRESARAVDVIDLERDRRYTADLGSVLGRSEGVGVRRTGALGADARLSLNGLTDEQVKVFIDGVPLELAGYPFGVNNVPVELLSRVDVHRGVVPLRLGADALGGAVELIGDEGTRGSRAHVSYQGGSFDTHRLLASGRHYDPASGLFVRVEGFFDTSRNDYPIRVRQQALNGRLQTITVRRNNDDYRAGFGSVEAGFLHRSWARRLTFRAFLGDMDKGVPSDLLMNGPYGGVTAARRALGSLLRFESVPLWGFRIAATGGVNVRDLRFRDLSTCLHDWVGMCTSDRASIGIRGERIRPSDARVLQTSGLGRLVVARSLAEGHELRLVSAPTFTRRTGEERALPAGDLDALHGRRDLLTVVSGLEYQADLLDERLQVITFAKHYFMVTHSEELLPVGAVSDIDRELHRAGGGGALRVRLTPFAYAKASYEYATRWPAPDQIFGDPTQLIESNLRLTPESAHNANLSVALAPRATAIGDLRGQLTLFARRSDDLIFMFTPATGPIFQNVDRATSLGVEGNFGLTSPGRWLSLDGNATYQDYRNRSSAGELARFRGGRMPSQPYLFANGIVQVFARGIVPEGDELSLSFRTSYVHDFVVGWENVNPGGVKVRVPFQLAHALALGLVLRRGEVTIGSTLEVHNLTDERVYDYLGVQLPGRSVAAKFTMSI